MRKQINSLLHESNTAWQNRQDTERKNVEENLEALTDVVEGITNNTETWTFTVVNGATTSTVTKILYIKPQPQPEPEPEAE